MVDHYFCHALCMDPKIYIGFKLIFYSHTVPQIITEYLKR